MQVALLLAAMPMKSVARAHQCLYIWSESCVCVKHVFSWYWALSSFPPFLFVIFMATDLAKHITTLDVCKGNWQVPVYPACKKYIALQISVLRLCHYTVLAFGFRGAPTTLQWGMGIVLQGCSKISAAYLEYLQWELILMLKDAATTRPFRLA